MLKRKLLVIVAAMFLLFSLMTFIPADSESKQTEAMTNAAIEVTAFANPIP